jgi:hypothetical protein
VAVLGGAETEQNFERNILESYDERYVCQDRLGTNARKLAENRERFLQGMPPELPEPVMDKLQVLIRSTFVPHLLLTKALESETNFVSTRSWCAHTKLTKTGSGSG